MRRLPRFPDMETLKKWLNRKRELAHPLSPSEYHAREEQEHFALIEWRDLMTTQMPELRFLFHVPNGEFRHKGTAVKLAKMGVLRGVTDFIWLLPRGKYHGLMLELKAKGGGLSPEQQMFLSFCDKQGYYTDCCWGWEEARRILTAYYLYERQPA